MDLVSRIVLGALQLSAAANAPHPRIHVAPLAGLLNTALGSIVPEQLIARASAALSGEADGGEIDEVIDVANRAALRITGAYAALERAAEALDTLLVLYELAQVGTLEDVRVQITSPDVFSYLTAIVLSRPGVSPLTVLVGSGLGPGERLEIPLGGGELLDKLRMSYLGQEDHPRWITALWVRCPPDPMRRRLEDWSGPVSAPITLEVYRRQVPGDGPMGLITTEIVALPHRLSSADLDLSLNLLGQGVHVIRTTISDKYQTPLLVTERVLIFS